MHDKRDSTGICFIGERPFAEFLANYLAARPGPIETPEGRRLGTHRGLDVLHARAARRASNWAASGAAEKPWYVAAKDLARNTLVVVQDGDHALLLADEIRTEAVDWIAGSAPVAPANVSRAR